MRYIIYSFLIFSFLIISTSNTNAQDSLKALALKYELQQPTLDWPIGKQKRFGAVISGKELQENGMVVVLRTQSKRLYELGVISRSSEISERQRANLKLKINGIQQENKRINTGLMSNFTTRFEFTDVYFVYDSSLTNLKNGVTTGIFVDSKTGKVDKSIELKSTNVYICNYTLVSSSNESEGLVVYNSKMERIKLPFPGVAVAGSSGLNMLLQLLTNDDAYLNRKIEKDVAKLEKNLNGLIQKGDKEFKQP